MDIHLRGGFSDFLKGSLKGFLKKKTESEKKKGVGVCKRTDWRSSDKIYEKFSRAILREIPERIPWGISEGNIHVFFTVLYINF